MPSVKNRIRQQYQKAYELQKRIKISHRTGKEHAGVTNMWAISSHVQRVGGNDNEVSEEFAFVGDIYGQLVVVKIGRPWQPAETPLERHRPDPFRQFPLLDVEGGRGEVVSATHMVEVGMRDDEVSYVLWMNAFLVQLI